MKIALCDWDMLFLENLKKAIYAYADLLRIDIVADCYNSGEKLLDSGINYKIIVLGYELCGINGFETAKAIRNKNSSSAIIYMSKNMDFVFDAFKINAFRFLPKPIEVEDIVDVIDEYFKSNGIDYPLWIKSGCDKVCLDTAEIYYLEANNKHCFIYLKSRSVLCNKTMARVFSNLPKNHFSKINRAYIVNLNLIDRYNNETVYLKDGTSLRIGRNYIKSFKEEYRRFAEPKEL